MKPNDTILNTDFYQLANDGSLDITVNIASGARADFFDLARFVVRSFNVGSAKADYDALIYDNKTGNWSSGLVKVTTANVEQVVDGVSYGTFSAPIEIRVFRVSGNQFNLEVAVTGLGGGGQAPSSAYFYLRESLQVRVKIKTFLQPEL